MGVGLFLFRTLTLKRERSALNLLMTRLSRQKRAITRRVGDLTRDFSAQRKALTLEFQHAQQGFQLSNTAQAGLDGSSGMSGYNCQFGSVTGWNNNPNYQKLYSDYQIALQNLENEREIEEKNLKEEEDDIQEQIDIAKAEMEQIQAELKQVEEQIAQAAKDGAPKYMA